MRILPKACEKPARRPISGPFWMRRHGAGGPCGRRPHPLRSDHPEVNPDHIKELVTYRLGDFMFLDEPTAANLELFRTVRGSL